MKFDKSSLLLYAVTDRAWLNGRTLYQCVEESLRGGVTCVQLREKDMDDDAFFSEAMEIKALCHDYCVPFVINDSVPVALRCGADGIHVGQHDMKAGTVRSAIGGSMFLGVSAQTVEQAVAAELNGADYLGVGAVFPTSTKLDADAVSIETLTKICYSVSIPAVAIGGVCGENIPRLSGTGIAGAALVSAIFAAGDIQYRCMELRNLLEESLLSEA